MWKTLFRKTILERGRLIKEECIKNVNLDNEYSATIIGSKEYNVTISKNFKIMQCTCPCVGFYCKHLAGFLFYLEKHHNKAFINLNKKPLNNDLYFDDYLSNKFKSMEDDILILEKLTDSLDSIKDSTNSKIYRKNIDILCLKAEKIVLKQKLNYLKQKEKNNEKNKQYR